MHRKLSRRNLLQRVLSAAAAARLIAVSRTSAAEPAKSDPQPAPAPLLEYRRPELLCIAWAKEHFPGKKPTLPDFAWRPDGSVLSKDELSSLHESAKGFALPLRDLTVQLPPLHLVFRIDERAKWKQNIMPCVRIGDRTYTSGSAMDSRDNHLAVSSISPFRTDLAEWPAKIDIEVRTPIAEPEMLLRLDEIPKGKVDVDRGVQWSIEPNIGHRRDGTRGAPAAVIWWSRKERNQLNDYTPLMTLKDGKQLRRDLSHPDYEISEPIEADNPIVSVEFWRRRYRLDRFENVPTFLDRMPK